MRHRALRLFLRHYCDSAKRMARTPSSAYISCLCEIFACFTKQSLQSVVGMTDGGYEDEFDDTSIFENKSGLAEVSLVKRDSVTRF